MAGPVERPPLPPTHQKTSLLKLLVVSGFAAHLLSRETANQSVLGVIAARRRTRKKNQKPISPPETNACIYGGKTFSLLPCRAAHTCARMHTSAVGFNSDLRMLPATGWTAAVSKAARPFLLKLVSGMLPFLLSCSDSVGSCLCVPGEERQEWQRCSTDPTQGTQRQ